MCPASVLFGTIADSIPEAVLVFAPAGRLAAMNPAASALTGLVPAAVGAVTLAELLEDAETAERILAAGGVQDHECKASLLSLKLYTPGGTQVALRTESWRIAAGGQASVAMRLFVSEADKHRRVLSRIAEGLVQSRSLPAAECQAASLTTAISEVCAFTGWAYAEAWIPAEKNTASGPPGPRASVADSWESHPFWYGSRERYGDFRDLSVKAGKAAPLPLVSRVAREQTASWYSDVSVVPLAVYRRARAAREAGLKTTFAQPIVENGRTLAVLVFMMAEVRARDDALAGLMAEVARRLAPLFRTALQQQPMTVLAAQPRSARTQGEDLPSTDGGSMAMGGATASTLDMLCRVLDNIGKPAMIVAQEGRRIVWMNAAACAVFDYERDALVGQSTAKLHVDVQAFEEFGRRAHPVLNAGRPFRQRFCMRRRDGTHFAAEHIVIPLGEVDGRKLSVSLLSDLGEATRMTFGRRLEQLSSREQEVLQLTIAGETVTEIATRLHLSVRTVETHRSHLLHKLGCASTTKLLAELLAEFSTERARL